MSALDTLRQQNYLERLRRKDPGLWSDDPTQQRKIADRLGWLTVHRSILANLDQLTEVAAWVRELDFRHAVLLGMGGSSLAPEVFYRTFGSAVGHPELIVLDTTDPTAILRVENRIDIETTLFIVSSKSGTTIETSSLQSYFEERMRDASGETGSLDNFIAITDPETVLHNRARDEGYHRIFVNPPDIGGRYSALSFFGLVPAAVIGVDVERLLTETGHLDWNEALELGAALGDLALEGRDKLTFLSERTLDGFGAWAEQLIAESTGKQGRGIVPVAGESPGPPGVYGEDRVFVFLNNQDHHSEAEDTIQALESAGHPVLTTTVESEYHLGREFLRWEIAAAVIGSVLAINPFDEPNVQESKDNTRQVLEEYVRAGRLPAPEPSAAEDRAFLYMDTLTAQRLGQSETRAIPDVVAAHLRAGAPPEYAAILGFIPPGEEHDRLLAQLRTTVRGSTRMTTTEGYGPRYLHSTGQLHKGGPQTGVFLLITADDPTDEDIPGESGFGFSVLKQAQALGDLQALQSRRRPVVWVHLRGDTTGGLRWLVEGVESSLSARAAAVRE
jgi:transaldolase/glucose-6-phosphate isomerase